MGKPKGTHYLVSASSTQTGAPLYFVKGDTWTDDLQAATAWESEAERDAALSVAADQEATVCDPYSFMVRIEGGKIDTLSAREAIRSNGPTVRVRRPDSGASTEA